MGRIMKVIEEFEMYNRSKVYVTANSKVTAKFHQNRFISRFKIYKIQTSYTLFNQIFSNFIEL